ncbi:conserved Plasmodium protein, unknown function [Plasmodium chabaudi chabaudi]|uniref:Acylated pleckstrin-homology domain-containing protein, putative n=2 Tax=Plasmodium chabaudi TaxID=5825 RepID=A0A077TL07_PLACU|nr:acylated pleckstrin-homology domain-containing protein, putative [Plasmodium chabaudi chabaudi]SCM02699.1 conserved Plasmodium protein, unknown function [Plasmodium chabaudi chabaudi]SCM05697.1 conserved Plasmodium protein, unknown function [Plasmodium chabaudi adami]VTZ68127.1 acylated pleckstrin-homology domain-containing protein, putative [Plasmodium chabaudi chabaudi]|eukprot:XP_016653663.1 conserved Plasmodium protein, unknown function [Plasmodium chabaudi chabaudi]
MGNTVPYSCYERWGKRAPDGPLINYDPETTNNGPLSNLLENFNYELKQEEYNANRKDHSGANTGQALGNSHENRGDLNNSNNNEDSSTKPNVIRNARRRPTYSPSARKINIENEIYDDDDEDEKLSTDNSGEDISAKNLKDEKIKEYRKILTKVVKIKTTIFHETVKVTCSKDGKLLEWYKGKADDDGHKKPIGSFPLNKITSIRTKVDNLKSLEISVSSVNINTYLFTFKTREERESWQNHLESFKNIMDMK